MTATVQELQNWLKGQDSVASPGTTIYRDPIRVVLAHVNYDTSGVRYLSNRPFSDATTGRLYEACIKGGVTFTENINLTGSPSIGYGDIEIDNPVSGDNFVGLRDDWLNSVWVNKPITVYIGDVRWSFSDFYPIFTGLVKDIDSKSRTSLNLILVDNMQRINTAVSDTVITGTGSTSNSQQLVPLTFGECFNVTPAALGVVGGVYQYQVHTGPINGIIEVRDNGAPVSLLGNPSTELLSTGKFSLARSPYGTITCSVQGATVGGVYQYRVGEVIRNIITNYGQTLQDSTYINATNFNSFDTNTPAEIGLYLSDRQNKLEVCNRIANSIGAYLVTGLDGKFKLTQVKGSDSYPVASYTPTYSVTQTDMEEKSFTIREKLDVQAAVKLGYCKNWTVQNSGLAGGLPQQNAMIFSREYYYVKSSDSTLIGSLYYNQSTEAPVRETLLYSNSRAVTEANRILNLYKTQRYIYTATYYGHMLVAELGDTVKITHPRFGLSAGKIGTIVEINRDWLKGRVTLGILI